MQSNSLHTEVCRVSKTPEGNGVKKVHHAVKQSAPCCTLQKIF